MNFSKKVEHDDNQLIQLLKKELREFPSEQLVERTLEKISAIQTEKKLVHKPLRIPLYIMAAITILLLAPFFTTMTQNSSSLNPLSEFLGYPESSILEYAVWCWLAVVVIWISGLLFQVQSKFDLNPFKL